MIVVCSLKDLETVCESVKPSHLISVIDPGYAPETPVGIKNHLKLGFDDIVQVSSNNHIYRLNGNDIPQLPPNKEHTDSIIKFSSSWNQKNPIVIHCWCGVSRSMATATYLMCSLDSSNIERNIRYIRSIAPHANPNKLMLSFYEKILNTKGKISSTFDKYPYSKTYDCEYNFAPVTIFDINDMKVFK